MTPAGTRSTGRRRPIPIDSVLPSKSGGRTKENSNRKKNNSNTTEVAALETNQIDI